MCIRRHLKSQIDCRVSNIKCPNTQCTSIFSTTDISLYLQKKQNNRWLELALNNYLVQGDNNIRNCSNPQCSFPFEVDPQNDTFFICTLCHTRTCIRHRVIFHEGLSCDEYERTNMELKNLQKVKRCPKCSQLLEKAGGCSHYKCVCGYEFCWKCLAAFEPIRQHGNHFHDLQCKFYFADPSRLPSGG